MNLDYCVANFQLDGCYSEPSTMETGYPEFGAYLNK